jgi:CRISPR-associated protein Cas5d
MPASVSVKVWGELALFSRPELKVERLSYPIMTPSAARGVLDAILFRPQMRWHVRRITALRPAFPPGFPDEAARQPYRLIGIRRNEIQGKIAPNAVGRWMREPASFEPYLVDSAGREGVQGQNRTQRMSLALQHVAYRIDATPLLTESANSSRVRPPEDEVDAGPDTVAKYVAMFQRRVRKGQAFHAPYLGCREFACAFAPVDGTEAVLEGWNLDLGFMLYDIRFGPDGDNRPGFFAARIVRGVLHCDTEATGPNGEAPVAVKGWEVGP